ncbi:pilin [Pseudomonas fluorescens]|uniref:pilin n=1 Tax=Pseudomonas fluorescens TaxID=294 RepID=UPI001241AE4F|nr:pilin [Pseudomonas fluorescens]
MNSQKGFTLIELLIVVAIIGILATFAIASFARFQAKAKVTAGLAEISALKDGFEGSLNEGTAPTLASVGAITPSANCIVVVGGTPADGVGSISCTFQNAPPGVTGTITLERSSAAVWSCFTTVTSEYAPKGCTTRA